MKSLTFVLPCFVALLCACPPPPGDDAGTTDDGGGELDAGPADAGADDAGVDDCPGGDAGDDEPETLDIGATQRGSVVDEQDQDAFHVLTTGGQPYRVHLSLPSCSQLQGHLTVIDDGRDGDLGGLDFVQISTTGTSSAVELEFIAMRDGHYAVVRDGRNVGQAGGAGGSDHVYDLRVEALSLDDVVIQDVTFPSTLTGTLPHAGAMHVYRFTSALQVGADGGTTLEDVIFDFSTTGDIDGRLFVIAEATNDWIARNDDRVGSVDPRIDAPMTEQGTLYLVVDNVEPSASDLTYSIEASKP
jgi:hypothetical protein